MIAVMARRGALKDVEVWQKISPEWSNPDGRISLEQLNADQDFYLQNGYLDVKADLSQVVDMQFVDYALDVLGPYR